ncbi:MAG: hypothetical protein JWM33_769 [Caulobacteraceae bacterium]|nr:hypothetical protein [Caulobacteraceae bacterium]
MIGLARNPLVLALACMIVFALAAFASLTTRAAQVTTTLPFRFDRGHVVVTASLKGRPTQAVLDTGMPHTIVDRAYAQQLGLKLASRGGLINGQRVQHLQSGPLTFGGVAIADADATDLTGVRAALGVPMVLGVGDLMDRRIVELDFRRHLLTLHPRPGFIPPPGATLVPLTARGLPWDRHYGAPVRVDGRPPIIAMLDLGADHALSLSAPAAARLGLRAGPAAYGESGVNSDGRYREARARISLGGLDLPGQDLLVAATGKSINGWNGNLGAQALARFHVWLDLGDRRLWLIRDPRYAIGLEETDQGIRSVTPGGAAQRAGLKAGDKVKAIDGQDPMVFWQTHDFGTPAPIRFEMTDGRVITVTPVDAYP